MTLIARSGVCCPHLHGRDWGKADAVGSRANDVHDPERYFATANCRIAKGLFDHLVGAGDYWDQAYYAILVSHDTQD